MSVVVGIFGKPIGVDETIAELKRNKIASDCIGRHARSQDGASMNHLRGAAFWDLVLGSDAEHDTSAYEREIADGSVVLTVRSDIENHSRICEILAKHAV